MPLPQQQNSKNTPQGADALMAVVRLLARQAARETMAVSPCGSETSPSVSQNREGGNVREAN
jgi:hypothetical protein